MGKFLRKPPARDSDEAKTRAAHKSADRKPQRPARRGSLIGYTVYEDTSPTTTLIESWLRDQDVPAPDEMRSTGGGFVATRGRLVLDSSGSGMGGAVPGAGRALSYGSGQGQVSAGLALVNTRRLRIYPLVGVSMAGGGTGVQPADVPGEDKPPSAERRSWGSGQATVGIGMDLLLSFWVFHLLIGLRAGMGYELFSMQIGGGDAVNTGAGPFFRVVIGGGLGRR